RRIVALIAIGIVAVAAWFAISLFQPFGGDGSGRVTVRVPKGASVGEIGDILAREGVISHSFFFELRARLGGDSGDLKPGVYQLKKGASARTLVKEQLQAFRQNFSKVNLSYARKKNLTPYDVLTIASMVEREAAVEKDRPLIASVIYNRLHDHMALGIDSTLR